MHRYHVYVQSLTVHNFYAGEGTDSTGVPTKLVTLNCSLAMSVHNPSTMFGIHVSSSSIRLMYSEIAIATGQVPIRAATANHLCFHRRISPVPSFLNAWLCLFSL